MENCENLIRNSRCVEVFPETLGMSRFAANDSIHDDEGEKMFSEYPDILTVDQLMELLHIGRNAAYGLLKSGEIKTMRIGRRYIIPKRSIVSFILSI